MEVRDARHEMTQRFDLSKSQAAMRVSTEARRESRLNITPTHASFSGAEGRLAIDVAPHSRTAQLLRECRVGPDAKTHGTTNHPGESERTTATATATATAAARLVVELYRADLFSALFQVTFPRLVSQFHCEGILTRAEQRELPARWVLQSLNELPSTLAETRERVTLLDVGATVRRVGSSTNKDGAAADPKRPRPSSPPPSPSPVTTTESPSGERDEKTAPSHVAPMAVSHESTELFEVVQTSTMSHGQYWVALRRAGAGADDDDEKGKEEKEAVVFRVDCADVVLSPPKPLRMDALIPCDEAYAPRGTATCLYLSLLLGTQRRRAENKFSDAFARRQLGSVAEPDIAGLTLAMSCAMADARSALWTQRQRVAGAAESVERTLEVWLHGRDAVKLVLLPPPSSPEPEPEDDAPRTDSTATAAFDSLRTVTLLARTLQKLARDFDAQYPHQLAQSNLSCVAPWVDAAVDSSAAAPEEEGRRLWSTTVTACGRCTPTSPSAPPPEANSDLTAALSRFFICVFTMLYRYRTLQGDEGYNGGPHAAVPPAILDHLRVSLAISLEAFASPLNHHLPLFGSLFPDTDAAFGSVGSFFDLRVTSGHVEVNPPFDTAVLDRTRAHIFDCLKQSALTAETPHHQPQPQPQRRRVETTTDSSPQTSQDAPDAEATLLFVVVLPSHDLDPWEMETEQADGNGGHTTAQARGARGKVSADRALRESEFCLAHVLCAAEESAYVDGQQHLLRAPLFCIRSPTRLIVLGNAAARKRYPDAADRLDQVRQAWRAMTEAALATS